ncbi:MAG: hypothetical protein HQL95_03880 [Magnetococcales bacterium]|nr:hypothetical protein [Magnetococcales bacterium]
MAYKNKPSRATPQWGFDFYAIDTGMKDYTDENRAEMRKIFQNNEDSGRKQRILKDSDIDKLISFTSDVLFDYMRFKLADEEGPRQKDNLEMAVRIEKESHELKEHLRLMGTDLKWQFDLILRKEVDGDFIECLQLNLDRMIKLCEQIKPFFSSDHFKQGGRPTDDLPEYINKIRRFYKNLNPFLDGIPPGKRDLPLQNYLKLSLEYAGIEFSGHPGTLITRSDEWLDKINKRRSK